MRQPDPHQSANTLGRVGAIAVSLALGAALLTLAGPRLYGQLVMLPGNPILAAVNDDASVSTRALQDLIRSRRRGLQWTDSGRTRLELAAAEILLAEHQTGGGARYHALMQEALATLRDGLARAPGDAYGWTRLAYARLALGEPADRIVPVLAMAIKTAPVESSLIFPRLELCLIEWPYFAQAKPAMFKQQIALAWRQSHYQLARLARITSRKEVVRAALLPGERAEFDRLFAAIAGR